MKQLEGATTVTQSSMAASIAAGAALAASGASLQSIFTSVNMFQMLMILPLIGAYIPTEILFFLQGFTFATLNFDFIPKPEVKDGVSVGESVACPDQEDEYLNDIGLSSECTFMNYSMNIALLIVFSMIHIVVALLYCLAK
jgi:hypothetical protein